jgi:hypothetical protein
MKSNKQEHIVFTAVTIISLIVISILLYLILTTLISLPKQFKNLKHDNTINTSNIYIGISNSMLFNKKLEI